MAPFELRRGEYLITTDRSRLDIDYIHRYLSEESYWAAGIPRDTLARTIEHALPFGLYCGERQAGFARVVTDFGMYAYLADVFVDEAHRGRGLGKMIMEAVVSHPDLQNLRRMMLGTRDAHGLYRQFGFTDLRNADRWMERGDPESYKKAAS